MPSSDYQKPESFGEQQSRNSQLRRDRQNLFVRNILNAAFMLVAAIAMVGLIAYSDNPTISMWCYGLGLFAVLIKMVEVVMRMPGIRRKEDSQPRKPF